MTWESYSLVLLLLLMLGVIANRVENLTTELRAWRAEWRDKQSEKLPDPTRPIESRSGGMDTYSAPGTAELLYRSGHEWRKHSTVRVGSAAAEKGKKKGWALRENGVLVEGKE